MRWKPIAAVLPGQDLEQDFTQGKTVGPVTFGQQCLYYKPPMGAVRYLGYDGIQRAFRREERCSSLLGCCRNNFIAHSLVLVLRDGTEYPIVMERMEWAKEALELVKEKAPDAAIGVKK